MKEVMHFHALLSWRQLRCIPGGQGYAFMRQASWDGLSLRMVVIRDPTRVQQEKMTLPNKLVHFQPQDMSCYNPCLPCQPCRPCGPTPLANSCNEPCVRQCQDSTVVIQPSPVVVTLPGPILSSFPQNTAVGNSTSAAVGSVLSSAGVPISSGGFGLSGLGSRSCGTRCLPC
ncbi:feather keratin 1-like [Chroicocephalus ridibundus]